MKIDMNTKRLVIGSTTPKAVSSGSKNVSTSNDTSGSSSQTLQNLSRKRALIDALIINQIAQSFIQKAVVISSRLKSIASDAIISGKIKGNDLDEALSGVRASLDEMPDRGVPPEARARSLAYMTLHQNTAVKQSIPEIDEELTSLREIIEEYSTGKKLDVNLIGRIYDRLSAKAAINEDTTNQFVKELVSESGTAYELPASLNYPNLIENTRNSIAENADVAMAVQGNIDLKAAKILLQ